MIQHSNRSIYWRDYFAELTQEHVDLGVAGTVEAAFVTAANGQNIVR